MLSAADEGLSDILKNTAHGALKRKRPLIRPRRPRWFSQICDQELPLVRPPKIRRLRQGHWRRN